MLVFYFGTIFGFYAFAVGTYGLLNRESKLSSSSISDHSIKLMRLVLQVCTTVHTSMFASIPFLCSLVLVRFADIVAYNYLQILVPRSDPLGESARWAVTSSHFLVMTCAAFPLAFFVGSSCRFRFSVSRYIPLPVPRDRETVVADQSITNNTELNLVLPPPPLCALSWSQPQFQYDEISEQLPKKYLKSSSLRGFQSPR